jgi:SAM-dependent methyltransferase
MKYLNLGCGHRFRSEWTNVDFISTDEAVIAHNLKLGIPFPDSYFDVVYHSHLLEHFPKDTAEKFLGECDRVLRPQGVLRVVVPDLEQIVNTYLTAIEAAKSGSQEWAANYDWILLEMYDQAVRNQSGGEMAKYLFREHIDNEEFIVRRCGTEVKRLIEMSKEMSRDIAKSKQDAQDTSIFKTQFIDLLKQIYRLVRYPKKIKELLIKALLGSEYLALEIGRFRQSGEVHQWMYDRYSLAILLQNCGLQKIVCRTATESYITGWSEMHLDTEPDGSTYKPDSLFIEAIKP